MIPRVVVIDTKTANVASVLAALRRAGAETTLSGCANVVARADRLLLPGVGSFEAGMKQLRRNGLVEPIREHVTKGRPLLAVCLGLQLLCNASEESPGVEGIGLVDAELSRFDEVRLVPQIGWNQVIPCADSRLMRAGYAYFANSYRLTERPPGWSGAMSHYGRPFVAALQRENVLACQFHPELSGPWGQALIERALKLGGPSC